MKTFKISDMVFIALFLIGFLFGITQFILMNFTSKEIIADNASQQKATLPHLPDNDDGRQL